MGLGLILMEYRRNGIFILKTDVIPAKGRSVQSAAGDGIQWFQWRAKGMAGIEALYSRCFADSVAEDAAQTGSGVCGLVG